LGKPYWGYENYLMGSTVTARTASSVYPATNLGLYTMHRWRSASKCVVLDGVEDYFWIADAGWNSYTGDFCFEFLVKPAVIDTSSSDDHIIDKWGAAGQRSYKVVQNDDDLLVYLSSDGTATAATVTFAAVFAVQWDRLKLSYDASDQDLVLRVDGVESGRVTVAEASGTASISGTVPASIHDGTARLTIGSNYDESGNFWAGSLGLNAFDNAENDNGGWLNPTSCDAYYNFDNSDGTDSSGNGRTIAEVSLGSGDYSNCTAYQWIGITMSSTLSPTQLMIDRRHNLSTGATVRVLNGSWFSSYASMGYKASVTAGEAIVLTLTTGGSAYQWLEINDPDNSDGYIEIPYIYLGDFTSMERAHLRGYSHEEPQPGNPDSDSFGNLTGHIIGGQVWAADLKFRCNSTDFATMQSVWDECARYRPVVFCEDADYEGTKTRLVKAYPINYQHIYTTNQWVESKLREVAIGL